MNFSVAKGEFCVSVRTVRFGKIYFVKHYRGNRLCRLQATSRFNGDKLEDMREKETNPGTAENISAMYFRCII